MAVSASVASPLAAAASSTAPAVDKSTIANNFTQFLTLLTAQLKNQNPLDPLDTNQFTQQLVQFSQVEQQLKQNEQLSTLIALQKSAQATAALSYVGKTVAVDGSNAQLTDGSADWSLVVNKPANVTVNIKDSTGQTAYSGTFAVSPGTQAFSWDGRGNDGKLWPNGTYTLSATGVDASGQTVAISSEIQGKVDAIDVSKSPPVLSMGGKDYAFDKIKRIIS